ASSYGAADYFLKIEGIKGESTDDKHKETIEIESWSWGATNAGATSGGGGGAGKVAVIDFKLGKRLDKSSPLLFLRCAQGQHIPHAILTCRKTGGDGSSHDYYTITFSDILVSSYQSSAEGSSSGDPVPTEQVSFNFQKIEIQYTRVTDP